MLTLEAALVLHYGDAQQTQKRFAQHSALGRLIRSELRRLGIQPLARECDAAPCITTFSIPSRSFIEECRHDGYELGADSEYLRERRWTQIATMGAITPETLASLFMHMNRALAAG